MLWDEGIVWGGTYFDDRYNPMIELVRVVTTGVPGVVPPYVTL